MGRVEEEGWWRDGEKYMHRPRPLPPTKTSQVTAGHSLPPPGILTSNLFLIRSTPHVWPYSCHLAIHVTASTLSFLHTASPLFPQSLKLRLRSCLCAISVFLSCNCTVHVPTLDCTPPSFSFKLTTPGGSCAGQRVSSGSLDSTCKPAQLCIPPSSVLALANLYK